MGIKRISILIIGVSISASIFIIGCNNKISDIDSIQSNNIEIKEVSYNEKSNNREYEWYIDQGSTGNYGNINCVPASITMALKWANSDFSKTPEDARNEYINRYDITTGWINTEALRYLKENGARCFYTESNLTEENLKKYINKGNIVLVDFNTSKITYNPNINESIGNPYTGESDHMAIVKGYKIIDDKLYFEMYDPSSYGNFNQDGSYIGKDRYYLGSELIEGIKYKLGGFIIVEDGINDISNDNSEELKLEQVMEDAIRQDLGLKSGPIYESDLKRVISLNIVANNINDTSIIEKMVNLDSIGLVNCGLENINFIKELKFLRNICFNMNKIKDISIIGKMENIERIEIAENKITDFSVLNDLPNLRTLMVFGNPVEEYENIRGLVDRLGFTDIIL